MSVSDDLLRTKERKRQHSTPTANRASMGEYKYCDAIEFPHVDQCRLDSKAPVCVYVEPPGTLRRFVRYPPEFISDPDSVGLFPRFGKDTITYPPAFVAVARDARIVGFRTVLSSNGFFFNDSSVIGQQQRRRLMADLAASYPANEENGFVTTNTADRFKIDPGGRPTKRIRGATVLLTSQEPSNYGSWLFRSLPKLHILAQIDLSEPLRYLAWAGLPTFLEYLSLLGIPEDRVIHHDPSTTIYHLEKVIVPSIRNNHAFLDRESAALFAGLRDKFGVPMKPGSRIYISRLLQSQNGSNQRIMLNEPELVERLVDLGFSIIAPETLSVTDQILAFSSAEMVVGPSGSGMFNVVFCHPGTKIIDIESEPHWIHAHRCLFASCGLRYGIFVGSAVDRSFEVHHQPWKVNIDALVSQIESFAVA
ncbi:MAG TPA: glycosyltransferase family 61 protein [Candidatus Sulfotelmatobacter sp.]|nr:glycosyltransferase family 61 protein [Candidatus Sulfotelmatobacter sp.]